MSIQRYTALDGVRGIAAIAVVAFHEKDFFGQVYPKSAYLAVDLFFCLSGFVIALAYDRKLRGGLGFAAFMRLRVVRLYPLYLAGTALTIGAVAAAIFIKHDSSQWTLRAMALAAPAALVMLPTSLLRSLFPLNTPAWSLFYEFVANATYASKLFLSNRVMLCVAGASSLGIIAEVFTFGNIDQGAEWPTAWWAIFRVFFSFPAGILIYRFQRQARLDRKYGPLVLLGLAVVMCLNVVGAARVCFDLAFVLAMSPLLVFVGAGIISKTDGLDMVYEWLGQISYPLYVLHVPIIMIVGGWLRRHNHIEKSFPLGLALLAFCLVVAWFAAILDMRLRRLIRARQAT